MAIKIGNKAPAFSLPNQDEEKVTLKDFGGKWLILFFYPKDNTAGCSIEAAEFTNMRAKFAKLNAELLGISADSCKSHRNFIEKKELKVSLLSDEDKKMLEKYGVWQLKKMCGKEYMGIVRTTVLVNEEGKVAAIWDKVKAKGHAAAVLEKLKELS